MQSHTERKKERLFLRRRERDREQKTIIWHVALCIWMTENLSNSLFFLLFMDLPVEGFGYVKL